MRLVSLRTNLLFIPPFIPYYVSDFFIGFRHLHECYVNLLLLLCN